MSTDEKNVDVRSAPASDVELAGQVEQPTGWLYRPLRLGPLNLGTYYASPIFQIIILSMICFLCPGMSNALSGLGGGGQLTADIANDATVATHCTFAVFAFFAGSICNLLGIKWLLIVGPVGYAVMTASYICFNHTGNRGFVIFGGALAGFCAALLWTAQGTVVMSYPAQEKKGLYFSICWGIFNMGAVLGALIALGMTINGSGDTVGDGTYIGFTVLMLLGSVLALALIRTDKVVREDGSKAFLSSNWFYTYQFNDFNLAHFNVRTRGLNNVVYWAMQILGSFMFGIALDMKRFSRPVKARALWCFLLIFTIAIWGAGLKYQNGFSRANVKPTAIERLDWTDKPWGGMFTLYIFWGFYDAAWQTSIYWYMGALSNNSRKLAHFAGFYKAIQSAGAAIVYRLDSLAVPYNAMFGIAWGLLMGGLIFALQVVWCKIKDYSDDERDLEFTDATKQDIHTEKPEGAR